MKWLKFLAVLPAMALLMPVVCLAPLGFASLGYARDGRGTQDDGSTAPPQSSQRRVRAAEAVAAEEVEWGEAGPAIPAAQYVALLFGRPDVPRPYILQAKALKGSAAAPHWHTTDIHITVIEGTLVFGVGDSYDETKAQKLGPGSYVLVPAGIRHYETFPGDTVYQLQGNGPLRTFYVRGVRLIDGGPSTEPEEPTLLKAPEKAAAKPAPKPPAPVSAPVPEVSEALRAKQEFEAAVAAFAQAVQAKDRDALANRVRPAFERIAGGGGPYAPAARNYLESRIPAELAYRGPCPAIGRPGNVGWVVQEVKPGDVVAPELLDRRLEWTSCNWPEFPPRPASAPARSGVVRLTVTLNETGNVVTVKARGGLYPPGVLEAAAVAVRTWRTNALRARGVPVRTEVSVDIPFEH